jgi:hypothetical protein
VRELSIVLRRRVHCLTDVVDVLVASAPHAHHNGIDGRTVTVDVNIASPDARAAVDILMTIDHHATTSGTPTLAIPTGMRNLVSWIADEVDSQTGGHTPTAYDTDVRRAAPPCPLLRAVTGQDLRQSTIHAYRHSGLTTQQTATIRSSSVSAALADVPGATLDQLLTRCSMPRLGLLAELGDLIELRAIFGIDHHWYPYDITLMALHDAAAAREGCACPTTNGGTGVAP